MTHVLIHTEQKHDTLLKPGFFNFITFIYSHFKSRVNKVIMVGFITSVLTLSVSILSGYILLNMIDTNNADTAFYICVCLFCAGTVLFSYANSVMLHSLTQHIHHAVIPNILKHLLRLPFKISNQFTSTDLSERFNLYETSCYYSAPLFFQALLQLITILVLLAFMLYCASSLALLYVFLSLAILIIKLPIYKKNTVNQHAQFVTRSHAAGFIIESLFQINKIRSMACEQVVIKKWYEKIAHLNTYTNAIAKNERTFSVLDSVSPFIFILTVYVILYASHDGIHAAGFIQFMLCAGQFSAAFQRFSQTMSAIIQFLPGLNKLAPLLSEEPECTGSHTDSLELKCAIHFKNISFKPNDSEKLILNNVSFSIPAGKFTAIIGESGAGKSTIFKLLLGLENQRTGGIFIDNQRLDDRNIHTFRRQCGVVLQNSQLFPGTIYSNIAMNHPVTLAEAWSLATCVGLDEEIHAMPMKMHTYLSDYAQDVISGGQKQKILLARALASKPKILLLDEATSALDNHSQAIIQQNLNAMNITRVVIAHRYSTISEADVVYKIDQGLLMRIENNH